MRLAVIEEAGFQAADGEGAADGGFGVLSGLAVGAGFV
jgi:hypothetical protein